MNNFYFNSADVKIFPCSNRGEFSTDNGNLIFDPEARISSEYNLTHLGNTAQSYIIEKTSDNTVKCVLGGYYIEIANFTSYQSDILSTMGTDNTIYIGLKTRSVELRAASTGGDSKRDTKLIANLYSQGGNAIDNLINNTYKCTGIALNTEFASTAVDFKLKFAIKETSANTTILTLCNDSFLPQIKRGTTNETSIAIGTSTSATGNNSFAAGNVTTASGLNSVALGLGTTADQENMVAVGSYNTTESNDLFVVGNGISGSTSNVLQVNKDKVVINKPTTITGNTLITGNEYLSGNFTIDTDSTNKFKVTAASGKTEIKGDLEINTDKFKIDASDGNTTIAGTLSVGSNETVGGTLEVTGAATLNSTLNVTGATTLSTTTISGTNFSVDANGNLISKGRIELGANTTDTDGNSTSAGVQLGKTDVTTEVKGKLIVGQTATIKSDLEVNTNNTNKFKVIAENGNTTIAGTTTINDDATIAGNLVNNGNAEIGKTGNTKIGKSVTMTKITGTAAPTWEANTYYQNINNYYVLLTTQPDDWDTNYTSYYTTTSFSQTTINGQLEVKAGSKFAKTVNINNKIILGDNGDLTAADGTVKLPSITGNNVFFGNQNFKATLLDLLYPKGSIYTYAIYEGATTPATCPIASTLGGTWERITERFLYAAGDDDTIGVTGGSANAVLIGHNHDFGGQEHSTNGHKHNVETTGTYEVSDGKPTSTIKDLTGNLAFRRLADGNKIARTATGVFSEGTEENDQNTAGYEWREKAPNTITFNGVHEHKGTAAETKIGFNGQTTYNQRTNGETLCDLDPYVLVGTTATKYNGCNFDDNGQWIGWNITDMTTTIEDGVGKNMPPYIAVYMWKRIS